MDKSVNERLKPNAITVLERRYLKKDNKGKVIETPADMFARVARNIASADKVWDKQADIKSVADDFYDLMTSLLFLPNSPTLMNAGRDLQQLSGCFVLPVGDSMEEIFDAIKNTALIHKSGGGTGFSFSRLRASKRPVKSTQGVSSGPISFMRVFNSATEAVKQGGTRRGANMGILRVDHPNILDFIVCKQNGDFENFNISVALTEAFMEAVHNGESYALYNPDDHQVAEMLDAREVYQKIIDSAWATGDPGIIFIDRINRDNPTPQLGEIEATNPCGEQPLLPFEACNLGSINLSLMVKNIRAEFVDDGHTASFYEIDWDLLRKTTQRAVHFLDNVVEMSQFPLSEITKMVHGNRKIGLGVMGWADLLIQLNVAYNSDKAVALAEEVMAFINKAAHDASKKLAKTRGAFPNFKDSVYDTQKLGKIRNAAITTIAPTGTISGIAGCSSGIEPLFAVSYVRNVMDNDHLVEVNALFERIARERGFYSPELMGTIAKRGSVQGLDDVPEDVQEIFVTAHDIAPDGHIRMQAAFQSHIDNAVSKTVNLSHDATPEDVRAVYDLAYELGVKGVTIYRDGSKDKQVLTTGGKTNAVKIVGDFGTLEPLDRPAILFGMTEKIKTSYGTEFVTTNWDTEGNVIETFINMGKAGSRTAGDAEALARQVSTSLRSGVSPDAVESNLRGVGGGDPQWVPGGKVLSMADGAGIVVGHSRTITNKLQQTGISLDPTSYLDEVKISAPPVSQDPDDNKCPDCGEQLEHESGCAHCPSCGYDKCG